ncbi:cytochrome c550 [Sediminibacillus halophilus]|uniref:Cytochrome c550 n=1 Tax=Sediminibacillus halophilus TaxID=482461 RepID=A0A1G9YHN3_9BACI|nr:cytochrome c [Sediminibacillus halophilus]SDN08699.1 cytochrome c550 [Sediminibacillus halophilus]
MKRNPVIPFAIIAVLGILTMIVLSVVGLNQYEDIQQAGEEGSQQEESGEGGGEEAASDDPEAIFQNNCASCHGGDLSGGAGPNLQEVGGRYSKDEIHEIIMNGTDGGMPAGLVSDSEADLLAQWLSEHK